jgi:hypothetical protein
MCEKHNALGGEAEQTPNEPYMQIFQPILYFLVLEIEKLGLAYGLINWMCI